MKKLLFILLSLLNIMLLSAPAYASGSFSIDSLASNYYLGRDKDNVSTLSAEEVFNVSFGSSGNTGFTRSIPAQYLKNPNDLKVTSVNDISGASVPFSSNIDSSHNVVIKIGDPNITIFGSHAYSIHYQSKGVINFLNSSDQFYPNFNGRGWTIPFGNITAAIHLTPALSSSLKRTPMCLNDSGQCTVDEQKKSDETVYTFSSQGQVPAHQSLTAKLDFKKGTFEPYKQSKLLGWAKISGFIVLILVAAAVVRSGVSKLKRRQPKSHKD